MKTHDINWNVQEEATAPDGSKYWRVATPLPYYLNRLLFFKRYQCSCGEIFKTEEEHGKHYRLAVKMAQLSDPQEERKEEV